MDWNMYTQIKKVLPRLPAAQSSQQPRDKDWLLPSSIKRNNKEVHTTGNIKKIDEI